MKGATAKASRTTRAQKQPPIAPVMLAPTAIDTFPFGRIKRAPENVRKTDKAADVAELAEDIAAHGLLQSLIGYAGDGIDAQVIYIVGGGRRLQALDLLHERGIIGNDWPVPVLVRAPDEAIELSLSENLARRDMNPADEFVAFAELMKGGALSPADLAKRFGFSEKYVKQRLRFAALHPELLDALRDGKLSIIAATEYAKSDDPEVQIAVFRAIMRGPQFNRDNLWHLKSMLSTEQMREDSIVFQFIDRATYEREGGGYVEDLFEDPIEARRLNNTSLAKIIATRCLEFQAVQVEARAKRDHPSVAGHVVEPLGLGRAKAPSGFVEITSGWNSTLNTHVNVAECWKRADKEGVPIHVVVGIMWEEPIGDDDDGSALAAIAGYSKDRFFVPKDMAGKVLPPKSVATYGGTQLTPEQQAEELLKREARLWAARLSVPKLSDVPGLEGRVFYDSDWLDGHKVKPGDPVTGDRTPSFDLRVFVSEEEIAANLDAGRARAIEIRDDRERRKAEIEAERQASRDAKAKAFADQLAALRALPELPAVIMASQYEDDELVPWYRWKTGEFFDMREDHEDSADAMGVADLDDLAENMVVLGDWFVTIEEFDARGTA